MKKVILIALPLMLMAGCNGGGSGDGSSSSAGLSYSGVATQANIDSDNAKYFTTGSLNAGQSAGSSTGSSLSGVVSNNGSVAPITKPSSISIVKVLQKPIRNINVDSMATPSFSGAVYEDNFSDSCTGGGTVSGSLSSTDGIGFTGTMTFNNCVEDGETLSGSTTVNGILDGNTDSIKNIDMVFTVLTVSSTDTNITMNGSMALVFSGYYDIQSTSNLVIRDNKTGKTNKMESFVLAMAENIGYDELYLSGKYYDAEYGYGDVLTITPFLIANGDYWPYSGEAEISGNGSSVTITAVNNTEYTMTVYGSDGSIVSSTEAWQFPFQL